MKNEPKEKICEHCHAVWYEKKCDDCGITYKVLPQHVDISKRCPRCQDESNRKLRNKMQKNWREKRRQERKKNN